MDTTHNTITFLMVGCQRAGTTWVYSALREHPEVYLPPEKQSYFFDTNYHKGMEWYLTRFANVEDCHVAVGEVATSYSQVGVIPLVAKHLPHIKLIMSMRHPIDRAYSYYCSRRPWKGWATFDEAIEDDPDILTRGCYMDQIEELLRYYDRDRLLLLFFDDLQRDERKYSRAITQFIGVSDDFESSAFGERRGPQSRDQLRTSIERMGLKGAVDRLKNQPASIALRKRMHKANPRIYNKAKRIVRGFLYRDVSQIYTEAMPSEIRNRLIKYYRPYNDRLAAFTGRDLSQWNE